jgi:hypothetical protein
VSAAYGSGLHVTLLLPDGHKGTSLFYIFKNSDGAACSPAVTNKHPDSTTIFFYNNEIHQRDGIKPDEPFKVRLPTLIYGSNN